MVNNGLTFQEQSWVPKAGKGTQLVLIPATRADNQEVTAIIEEHKLFFIPCIIALMFTCDHGSKIHGMYILQLDQLYVMSIKLYAMR